jgi:flagellar hook-associated protein 3 FlgL
LRDFRTKLLAAANAPLNADNRIAVATELKEQKKHMISLANSQLNGQYLFSGSAVNTKPIDSEGDYHGNSDALMTLVGDGVKIQHNIEGKSLFLGSDLSAHKEVSTNVRLKNQIDSTKPLTADNTIKDMVGDEFSTNVTFFISGTKRDGEAFKDVLTVNPSVKIDVVLERVKKDFGGDVGVELTKNGNISITDLKRGHSSIEFNMVGVQGLDPASNINDLDSVTGEKIIPFTKSNYKSLGDPLVSESLKIDQQYFEKKGGVLEGNVALVADDKFADATTKFSDIMNKKPMPDKTFEMKVKDINGATHSIKLNLDADSTFYVDSTDDGDDTNGTEYNIYDADGGQNGVDDFTVGQLNNIVSMVLSNKLPATTDSATDFNDALIEAKKIVDVSINDEGHMKIIDKSSNLSNIEFSMYDSDANDFSNTTTPSISFMSNNAVTTHSANINFFDDIDSIIEAVEHGYMSLDDKSGNPRSIGIQNAINSISQLDQHMNSSQAEIGVRSKSLEVAEQKADALKVNVKQLKSETTEVDIAETIMKLNQATLSYQAMLQTVTKVNALSLLNYLR